MAGQEQSTHSRGCGLCWGACATGAPIKVAARSGWGGASRGTVGSAAGGHGSTEATSTPTVTHNATVANTQCSWAGADSLEREPAAADSGARAKRTPRRVETPLEETCFQAEPESAICVQSFDDSLNSAIRTTYRISLRSSSLREPRYPSAGVVCFWWVQLGARRAPLQARVSSTRRRRAIRETTPRGAPGETNGEVWCALRRPQPPRHLRAASGDATRKRHGEAGTRRIGSRQGELVRDRAHRCGWKRPVMILPQVHLRKPCYDFSFL